MRLARQRDWFKTKTKCVLLVKLSANTQRNLFFLVSRKQKRKTAALSDQIINYSTQASAMFLVDFLYEEDVLNFSCTLSLEVNLDQQQPKKNLDLHHFLIHSFLWRVWDQNRPTNLSRACPARTMMMNYHSLFGLYTHLGTPVCTIVHVCMEQTFPCHYSVIQICFPSVSSSFVFAKQD